MEAFLGTILPWAGSYAPQGWVLCQGQLLSVSQYQALYAILGNTYGGTPNQTFGVPDLRGRVPLGAGSGPQLTARTAGATGGVEAVAAVPAHTHVATFTPSGPGSLTVQVEASSAPGNTTDPQNNYLADAYQPGDASGILPAGALASYVTPSAAAGTLQPLAGVTVSGASATGAVAIGPTGSIEPVQTISPFAVINFIICVQGFYPMRPD